MVVIFSKYTIAKKGVKKTKTVRGIPRFYEKNITPERPNVDFFTDVSRELIGWELIRGIRGIPGIRGSGVSNYGSGPTSNACRGSG